MTKAKSLLLAVLFCLAMGQAAPAQVPTSSNPNAENAAAAAEEKRPPILAAKWPFKFGQKLFGKKETADPFVQGASAQHQLANQLASQTQAAIPPYNSAKAPNGLPSSVPYPWPSPVGSGTRPNAGQAGFAHGMPPNGNVQYYQSSYAPGQYPPSQSNYGQNFQAGSAQGDRTGYVPAGTSLATTWNGPPPQSAQQPSASAANTHQAWPAQSAPRIAVVNQNATPPTPAIPGTPMGTANRPTPSSVARASVAAAPTTNVQATNVQATNVAPNGERISHFAASTSSNPPPPAVPIGSQATRQVAASRSAESVAMQTGWNSNAAASVWSPGSVTSHPATEPSRNASAQSTALAMDGVSATQSYSTQALPTHSTQALPPQIANSSSSEFQWPSFQPDEFNATTVRAANESKAAALTAGPPSQLQGQTSQAASTGSFSPSTPPASSNRMTVKQTQPLPSPSIDQGIWDPPTPPAAKESNPEDRFAREAAQFGNNLSALATGPASSAPPVAPPPVGVPAADVFGSQVANDASQGDFVPSASANAAPRTTAFAGGNAMPTNTMASSTQLASSISRDLPDRAFTAPAQPPVQGLSTNSTTATLSSDNMQHQMELPDNAATAPHPSLGTPDEGARVLAMVGDQTILASDLLTQINESLLPYKDQASEAELNALRDRLMRERLPQLIERKLIFYDFVKDIPFDQLPKIEHDVFKYFNEDHLPKILKERKLRSAAEFDAKLRSLGSSLAAQQRMFFEEVVASQAVQRESKQAAEVTHDELLSYYEEHIADYSFPAKVKWERIAVDITKYPTKEAAYNAAAHLGNEVYQGGSLPDVARRASDGPQAPNGGQYDWTSKNSLKNVELDRLLFAIPVGQLSKVIEGDGMYQIVRVIERTNAGARPFETVQNEIKETVNKQRANQRIDDYIARLRDKTYVWTAFSGEERMPTANAGEIGKQVR